MYVNIETLVYWSTDDIERKKGLESRQLKSPQIHRNSVLRRQCWVTNVCKYWDVGVLEYWWYRKKERSKLRFLYRLYTNLFLYQISICKNINYSHMICTYFFTLLLFHASPCCYIPPWNNKKEKQIEILAYCQNIECEDYIYERKLFARMISYSIYSVSNTNISIYCISTLPCLRNRHYFYRHNGTFWHRCQKQTSNKRTSVFSCLPRSFVMPFSESVENSRIYLYSLKTPIS